MRPYRKKLDELERILNNLTGREYNVGFAYEGYRVEVATPGGGASDVSPRLKGKDMVEWLNAFIRGIEVGMEVQRQRAMEAFQTQTAIQKAMRIDKMTPAEMKAFADFLDDLLK